MKDKIKQLRIDIDGISQLVKELTPRRKYVVDIAYIPKSQGVTLEKFIEFFDRTGYAIINSEEEGITKSSIFNAFQYLPVENKELDKCYDSLILAKAWLGKILGELGEETPYKNDGNRSTVEDIEPTSDVNNKMINDLKDSNIGLWFEFTSWKEASHIEKVDIVRERIKLQIDKFTSLMCGSNLEISTIGIQENIHQYLTEARFWLGFELQRIKEESELNKVYGIDESK